ncbi:MAG: A/G-specific adenine glycosylase [Simkaniaceae bacterium]|nr:A/G-specific adenine glycosylase [Simkaniaceae bacterium]
MKELETWFLQHQRTLPWRENITPYRVWISEVMLQQTQVSVVIPYFIRWMERFPTIDSLAKANIDDVIKLWEGLGYYSRARNLHAAANQIVTYYGGELPQSRNELLKIKGFGPYTSGAVSCFAFGQNEPAVDGNVMRVMTRFFDLHLDISKSQTRAEIEKRVSQLLLSVKPRILMEGLIELGALICTKTPSCLQCPIKHNCKAFERGTVSQLPVKAKRVATTKLHRDVACIFSDDALLISRGEMGKVMADLWEFPYFEKSEKEFHPKNALGVDAELLYEMQQFQHTFTRFRVILYPTVWRAKKRIEIPGFTWESFEKIGQLPFSSGHRKILSELQRREECISK